MFYFLVLFRSVESTALRLIMGLGCSEVQPQLSRVFTETNNKNNFLFVESEELNRTLVLTLARAMHITGELMYSLYIYIYIYNMFCLI